MAGSAGEPPRRFPTQRGRRPAETTEAADAADAAVPMVPVVPRAPAPVSPTEQLPHADPTEQLPASHTEQIPETHPDRPTRAIRQVRRRTEDGAWPAIPMLPVIKPDAEPMSELDRVREQRGMRALREHVDEWRDRDADAPAWPEREDPPGTLYPPRS